MSGELNPCGGVRAEETKKQDIEYAFDACTPEGGAAGSSQNPWQEEAATDCKKAYKLAPLMSLFPHAHHGARYLVMMVVLMALVAAAACIVGILAPWHGSSGSPLNIRVDLPGNVAHIYSLRATITSEMNFSRRGILEDDATELHGQVMVSILKRVEHVTTMNLTWMLCGQRSTLLAEYNNSDGTLMGLGVAEHGGRRNRTAWPMSLLLANMFGTSGISTDGEAASSVFSIPGGNRSGMAPLPVLFEDAHGIKSTVNGGSESVWEQVSFRFDYGEAARGGLYDLVLEDLVQWGLHAASPRDALSWDGECALVIARNITVSPGMDPLSAGLSVRLTWSSIMEVSPVGARNPTAVAILSVEDAAELLNASSGAADNHRSSGGARSSGGSSPGNSTGPRGLGVLSDICETITDVISLPASVPLCEAADHFANFNPAQANLCTWNVDMMWPTLRGLQDAAEETGKKWGDSDLCGGFLSWDRCRRGDRLDAMFHPLMNFGIAWHASESLSLCTAVFEGVLNTFGLGEHHKVSRALEWTKRWMDAQESGQTIGAYHDLNGNAYGRQVMRDNIRYARDCFGIWKFRYCWDEEQLPESFSTGTDEIYEAVKCAKQIPDDGSGPTDGRFLYYHNADGFADAPFVNRECRDDCKAELYQHGDFTGWKAVYYFTVGTYSFRQFLERGARNDDASAIKVIGDGCKVELYQHGDFTGWTAVFTTGAYNIHQFIRAGARNDDCSSIKVMKSGS